MKNQELIVHSRCFSSWQYIRVYRQYLERRITLQPRQNAANAFTLQVFDKYPPMPLWSTMWDRHLLGHTIVMVTDDGKHLTYKVGTVTSFIEGHPEAAMHICDYFPDSKCPHKGKDVAIVTLPSGELIEYQIDENNHAIIPIQPQNGITHPTTSWYLHWHQFHLSECTFTQCICG